MAKIECGYVNNMPQALLKVGKDVITNPENVTARVVSKHVHGVNQIEQSYYEIVTIDDPCGGGGTIQGKVLLKQIILIADIQYIIVLEEKGVQIDPNIYDGREKGMTVFDIYNTMAFDENKEEEIIDESQVTPEFTIEVTPVPLPDYIDFYLFMVEGTVDLTVG